jgi:hypothetical protein
LNHGLRAAAARGRGRAADGLMDNVSSFGGDIAALASLQSQLAAADARAGLAKAVPAIGGLVVAVLLAVAGTVAIVGGLALWIAESYAIKPSIALMLTGLGALIVVALLGVVSVRLLISSATTFRRSIEELQRNIAWIKTTLTYSGR